MIRAHRHLVEEAIEDRWPDDPMSFPERERLRRWLDAAVPDSDGLYLCALISSLDHRPPAPISAYLGRRWAAEQEHRRAS